MLNNSRGHVDRIGIPVKFGSFINASLNQSGFCFCVRVLDDKPGSIMVSCIGARFHSTSAKERAVHSVRSLRSSEVRRTAEQHHIAALVMSTDCTEC